MKGCWYGIKLFERIGFKNVMQVKDFPKDDPEFDPANIKSITVLIMLRSESRMRWDHHGLIPEIVRLLMPLYLYIMMLSSW